MMEIYIKSQIQINILLTLVNIKSFKVDSNISLRSIFSPNNYIITKKIKNFFLKSR